jgi:hypothetical protein
MRYAPGIGCGVDSINISFFSLHKLFVYRFLKGERFDFLERGPLYALSGIVYFSVSKYNISKGLKLKTKMISFSELKAGRLC